MVDILVVVASSSCYFNRRVASTSISVVCNLASSNTCISRSNLTSDTHLMSLKCQGKSLLKLVTALDHPENSQILLSLLIN